MSDTRQNIGWMWYPADLAIYHCMLQNFSREERDHAWPAFWKMDDWNKNVQFSRTVQLETPTEFLVTATGVGYVSVNGQKYPLGKPVACGPGKTDIAVAVGNMTGLPAIYVEGEVICSDSEWRVTNFIEEHPVGHSSLYRSREVSPNTIPYRSFTCQPVKVSPAVSAQGNNGVLYDYGRLVNGTVQLSMDDNKQVTLCYGESDTEALDEKWCYYKEEHATIKTQPRRRAFRYIFIPDVGMDEVGLTAVHTYVDIPVKASFHCDDELVNRIFAVAVETFRQCSGLFFIDGVKRDRWVWSGDAYQSYVVNPYIFFDEEINKRTLLGLRGNLGIQQHLNTIVDYSLLWILGVEHEYQMTGDLEFLREIYPKVEDLMEMCMAQTDENGFIIGRPQDWIFVDWADIDKTGPISAEQVLFVRSYEVMAQLCERLGKDGSRYREMGQALKQKLNQFFWSPEKGAFIDSYQSGRNHVTRHANIFAVCFEVATPEQQKSILENVILNPDVPQITTPYFKFFELDTLCKLGYLDEVFKRMKEYWGGMLERGAVTFWEEFDPNQSGPEQYAMYDDPFGKSLCHAWGASPIYLLGRYFLGVRPTSPGYATYEVKPVTRFFKQLDCQVPVKDGVVRITCQDGVLDIKRP